MNLEVGQNATKVFFFLHFFLYYIQINENQKVFFSQETENLLFIKKEELKTLFTQRIKVAHSSRKKICGFSKKNILFGKTAFLRNNFN